MLDVLRDQLNRRQPMDNVSRNLLRLLTATCGYKEARLMAVQRLEMWLQNPKVLSQRPLCFETASFRQSWLSCVVPHQTVIITFTYVQTKQTKGEITSCNNFDDQKSSSLNKPVVDQCN